MITLNILISINRHWSERACRLSFPFCDSDIFDGGETAFVSGSEWADERLAKEYDSWSECARGHVAVKPRKVLFSTTAWSCIAGPFNCLFSEQECLFAEDSADILLQFCFSTDIIWAGGCSSVLFLAAKRWGRSNFGTCRMSSTWRRCEMVSHSVDSHASFPTWDFLYLSLRA